MGGTTNYGGVMGFSTVFKIEAATGALTTIVHFSDVAGELAGTTYSIVNRPVGSGNAVGFRATCGSPFRNSDKTRQALVNGWTNVSLPLDD